MSRPKVMGVLAREAGVKVVTSLYNHSLSNGPEANTTLALMKHNLTQIVNVLKEISDLRLRISVWKEQP